MAFLGPKSRDNKYPARYTAEDPPRVIRGPGGQRDAIGQSVPEFRPTGVRRLTSRAQRGSRPTSTGDRATSPASGKTHALRWRDRANPRGAWAVSLRTPVGRNSRRLRPITSRSPLPPAAFSSSVEPPPRPSLPRGTAWSHTVTVVRWICIARRNTQPRFSGSLRPAVAPGVFVSTSWASILVSLTVPKPEILPHSYRACHGRFGRLQHPLLEAGPTQPPSPHAPPT